MSSSNNNNKSDHHQSIHLNPDEIQFSIYSSDEIRKLCVKKITTPVSLDPLGYPIDGGLYDLALGPMSMKGDPCRTCQKGLQQCSGHFGLIELPVIVVNPLFHKTISILMKNVCLECYKIQLPSYIKHSVALQMQLLNAGFLSEAVEIELRISALVIQFETYENIPEESLNFLADYKELTEKTTGLQAGLNKNSLELKNKALSDVMSKLKVRSKCLHCENVLHKVMVLKDRIIMSNRLKVIKHSNDYVSMQQMLMPEESRRIMREIWVNEKDLLLQLVPVLGIVNLDCPTDIFYMDVLALTPPNCRPLNMLNDTLCENKQSAIYKSVLQGCILLRSIAKIIKSNNMEDMLSTEAKAVYNLCRGNSPLEKFNTAWESLQKNIDNILDNKTNPLEQGIKQIIEKKNGVIRMHMMGKRVNFAARSVITPDPNLNIDEIGIPEAFAISLTYPVPVTSWNVEELRKMIMNGPKVHPGAVMVEFEDGFVVRIPEDTVKRQALLKRLLTPDGPDKGYRGVKLVYRHLVNGDVMLLNRQPTLHKPSIMAHNARILKGEKTMRLHYANCKAYNADFDGDEMNAHFPQSELARSEGYNIANVSNQYLVPKDGTPLSGLIQDHMISGVRMSIRGKFFNKHDYQQNVFQALSFKPMTLKLLPPAIVKPRQLWSGKQILSTVIMNIIPKGKEPINLTATAKIPTNAWLNSEVRPWKAGGTPFKNDNVMSEAEVVIRNGELLVGVLDKTHYGATPYGLIHCMYELYGGTYAIRLLSSLAKLFMNFLQREGFTLGVHDILVLAEADKLRTKIVEESRKIGKSVMQQALNLKRDDTTLDELTDKLQEQTNVNPKIRAIIDRQYKSSLDTYTNQINKACVPAGLICKFPYNNLQLMVLSGAKGSTVNTMQISCLLGQIELEGKRPPVMISGRSLPSFPPHEFSPRSGGFIDGRFMTGIQPQEFFFHCMAGREGLIDTAVKTSRSGYLQRCLIKHLEGLTIGYDMTVRDSDKSVIQFCYGEDGMDINKAQFLNVKQLGFLADNIKAIVNEEMVKDLTEIDGYEAMLQHKTKIDEWRKAPFTKKQVKPFTIFSRKVSGKINLDNASVVNATTGRDRKSKFCCELWQETKEDVKAKFKSKCVSAPEPVASKYQPDYFYGSINERLVDLLEDYRKKEGDKGHDVVTKMLELKAMQSLCSPGEPVGLLAAQSIGEPSTQMTLNTFHFAGRGEMNVTLGIPRLREILMMASKNLKTPSMEIPFLPVPDLEKRSEKLRRILNKCVVASILEKIDVTQELELSPQRQNKIVLKFQFLPRKLYKKDYCVRPKQIIEYMGEKFFKIMFLAIKKIASVNTNVVSVEDVVSEKRKRKGNDANEDDYESKQDMVNIGYISSDEENEEPEDVEDAKATNKFDQVNDDAPPEDEEIENEEVEADVEKKNEENEDKNFDELGEDEVNSLRSHVVSSHDMITNFRIDKKNYLWCELTFRLPLTYKSLDLTALLRQVAAKAVIWDTPGINRAITYMNNDKLMLRTDGINIIEMFKYNELLDLNKLYSNDIHQVAWTYGIEAAQKVIVKEIKDVFNVYGITIDARHLSLVADYMTYGGSFQPLSRKGMETSVSPFQQMSFESSLVFLKKATLHAEKDSLSNPSSCLMLGKPCHSGTGSFTLMQRI